MGFLSAFSKVGFVENYGLDKSGNSFLRNGNSSKKNAHFYLIKIGGKWEL